MKLKTLKDIPDIFEEEMRRDLPTEEEYFENKCVPARELKEEAIKWVKEALKTGNDVRVGAWLAFREFHNITEEELK